MTVMITGASGGLGRALSAECARRGYNLFLTDINGAGLQSLRSGLERQYGVLVAAKACDLTCDGSVSALLDFTDGCGFQFDMLLNVAGVDFEGGFLERERKNVLDIVSLNIGATLRITHGVLSRRHSDRAFYLVFVSSLASMYPMPLKATYAASKRFLLDFSIALRQELRERNVKVLALCPAGLATTAEAIHGIEAQGIWGSATTNRLESVAIGTVNKALEGRSLYIPGVLNRGLYFFGKLFPRSAIAAILYNRWSKAQSKWLRAKSA
ncbi:MAG: SDR family NAD(P)-dependent oxidoreductase [Clostridia bacterium]|nr:SDR family NAD(P)-dependent oxidoreductase [Clostridia bacterium]